MTLAGSKVVRLSVFLLLSILLNSMFAHQWSLYLDDYVQIPEAVATDSRQFWTIFIEMLTRNWEMRPLRAFEWLLKREVHSLFGLIGLYHFQALVTGLTAFTLHLLLRKRFGSGTSFLIALLFLLSPLDSTQSWLATFHWRLSLLLVVWAMLLVVNNIRFWPGVLLASSFLLQEGCAGIFLSTPLLYWRPGASLRGQSTVFRSYAKKVALYFLLVFITYAVWRIYIAPSYMSDMRLSALSGRASHHLIAQVPLLYVVRLTYGYILMAGSSFLFVFEKCGEHPSLFSVLLVITGLTGLAVYRGKIDSLLDSRNLEKMMQRSKFLPAFGLLSIPFAFWLCSWGAPSRHIGCASRFNCVASISHAFFLAGLLYMFIGHAARRLGAPGRERCLRALVATVVTVSFAGLVTTKIGYQLDYTKAARIQDRLRTEMARMNPLPESLFIFTENYNHKKIAVDPVGFGDRWKLPDGTFVQVIAAHYVYNISQENGNMVVEAGESNRIEAPPNMLHQISLSDEVSGISSGPHRPFRP